ncbi:hypothetical protein R1flu_005201 [Riccia fluitans]|uniref:Uncharacterized protein n=1 Tax=Riccia fluitans TaxID=41844 RepID=A0ABD1YSG7_9MARC
MGATQQLTDQKEEVQKLTGWAKEVLESLTKLVEVQKDNKHQIAELLEEKARSAVQQVRRDAEASQWIVELQDAHEASENALREQKSKYEELPASSSAAQREAG